MKVITIKQPFATLIIKGYKKYEFRTWCTKYRGDILIHAGLGVDKKALERFKYLNLEYPSGCIIGKVTITDCIKVDDTFRKILKDQDERIYHSVITHQDWQGYAFKMENPEEIDPITCKGKLSLWDFEYPQNK